MVLEDWQDYRGVALRQIKGTRGYTYLASHVALDADGSPRAYHPQNKGIDANANAGFPNGGWRSVLAVDPNDKNKRRPVHRCGQGVLREQDIAA